MHPILAAVYRRKTAELESLLEDAQHKDEAVELIRLLVENIELMPSESGGVEAIPHGDLARILALCSTGAAVVKEAKPLRAVSAAGFRYDEALAWFYQSRALRVFGCGDRI